VDDETAHFVCSFQSRPDLQGVKTGALKTVVRTAANSSKADPIFRGSKRPFGFKLPRVRPLPKQTRSSGGQNRRSGPHPRNKPLPKQTRSSGGQNERTTRTASAS